MSEGYTNREDVECIASIVLQKMQAAGVEGDVLYSFSKSSELSLRDGEIEECTSGSSHGIGIRTIQKDGRQGVASGDCLDTVGVEELLAWSLHNSKNAEVEEHVYLHSGKPDLLNLGLFDPSVVHISPDDRMRSCQAMTSNANAQDRRVRSVRAASWSDGWGESFYASTTGFSGWKRGTFVACSSTVVMQDDESTEMGGESQHERFLDKIDVITVAKKSVHRTSQLLGATSLPTGRYTIVFDHESAASLIAEVGGLFCASEIHKGHSLLAGKMNTSIATSLLSLTDAGRLLGGLGTTLFDSEGVPTQSTKLIDKGIVNAFLYNLKHAAIDGVPSTGSAVRSLSSLPDVGTSNLIIEPGSCGAEACVRAVKKGLIIFELMGLHTLDPISGDFSLGVKGRFIEDGVMVQPVSGMTIAGNLLDLLKNIVAIGDDLTMVGSVGACTLVVEDIAVAGI